MNDVYMRKALNMALKAQKKGNVPVGAVIVCNNKVISVGYNMKNSKNVSLYHAELIAIKKASNKLKRWILDDCDLYVTMKPCQMCHYAIGESRIKNVYYLIESNYYQNLENVSSRIKYNKLNIENDYNKIVNNFFVKLRNESKKS